MQLPKNFPRLAKALSAGGLVLLAMVYSRNVGREPAMTDSVVVRRVAGVTPPRVSKPLWLVDPHAGDRFVLEDGRRLELETSNNNLAIGRFQGRLYIAFRSATHHHPKPPVWAPQYIAIHEAKTRLYVLSTALPDDAATLPGALSDVRWRLEGEGNDWLRRRVLHAQVAGLLRGDVASYAWMQATYGSDEAKRLLAAAERQALARQPAATVSGSDVDAFESDYRSVLAEFDIREPLFFSVNGNFFLYFQQVEGRSMHFNSLRTWAVRLDGKTKTWDAPLPVLAPKEHFWEVQVRKEGARDVAYLSSYSGAHYEVNAGDKDNRVHFNRSTDGIHWSAVDGKAETYRGGASEAGFAFDRNGDVLAVLRLDDGDQRGWGALFARGKKGRLADWSISDRADPRRFDSPRMFLEGGRMFLLARQNLCGPRAGEYDLTVNCPYDRSFVQKTERSLAERAREAVLEKMSSRLAQNKEFGVSEQKMFEGNTAEILARGDAMLRTLSEEERGDVHADRSTIRAGVTLRYEIAYYLNHPKRTTLYVYDEERNTFEALLVLPSSGDTAFPSIIPFGEGKYLVANYSSPPEDSERSWKDGQERRTGIYLVLLDFGARTPAAH